ncbi:MAG: acyl carrier protein [Gemmatimonadales bacterium]
MTNMNGLRVDLAALFAERLHVEVPSTETDLLATGRIDSVTMIELLLLIEERFGIRIDLAEVDFEHFRSLASIAEFIGAHRSAASGRLGG